MSVIYTHTSVSYVTACLFSAPEKGRRVKSGSAGEAGSSSHSERSNSLGSLKGTGKKCLRHTKNFEAHIDGVFSGLHTGDGVSVRRRPSVCPSFMKLVSQKKHKRPL